MPGPVVTDSGPLISLERIGQLDLLPEVFGEVFAPPAVLAEFGRSLPWLLRLAPACSAQGSSLTSTLHPGESEALALAQELGWLLLIDELRGRKVALRLGLSIRGTAGVLVMAKAAGLIPAVAPFLTELVQAGIFLDARVIRTALVLAGEP